MLERFLVAEGFSELFWPSLLKSSSKLTAGASLDEVEVRLSSPLDAFLLLRLERPPPSNAAIPSHCAPRTAPGVPGRLLGRLMLFGRLPMLVRARACGLLPETPSSLRRASVVASSSMADHPSWVPRSKECATALVTWSGDEVLPVGACFTAGW
jgi:hypothetical protein